MKELIQYLKKYFWKYRGRLIAGIFFVGAANFFRNWQPKVIRDALDTIATQLGIWTKNGQSMALNPEIAHDLSSTVFKFGLLIIGLAILMGVFMFFMRQTIIVVSRLIEYDMRKEIFEHYESLHLSFFKKNNTGDLMSRVSEDVSKVRMFLGPTILYGVDTILLFTMTIYSMLSVNVELTLWSLLPLPFLSISIFWVSSIIHKRSEKIQAQLGVLNSTAQEVFSGIRVVKSYAQEQAMGRFFGEQAEIFRQKNLALIQVDAFFFPLMLLLIGTSTIITVYVGGLKVIAGEISPGNIAEFVIYVAALTWPITSIGWIASLTQQAAASQKRINEFLKISPEITNPVLDPKPILGDIRFENVTFKYPDTGIVALENVSFELKAGQKLAIIGRTGCGKTSLADLLLRLYDVTSGRILIDGKDIREVDLANLRQRIGYVPQDVFLFSDSIFRNIGFGKPDLTQAEAEKYARSAAVHEEILTLPDGYDTVVGERGVTLSGGQKQRVSIARAFAKQPDLMILDDCLSAVDTTTEQTILGYLNESLAEKTSIIITHRIYGLLSFDKIIVLDLGKIVEQGTHEELLANGGYYSEIFERQVAEEV
jgi:ATP-binding cassette, subfamily B, multidrug efflux pump